MKKRNILSLFITALCVLVLAGVSEVNAAANYHVVCNPDTISVDDTADCYVIGNLTTKIDGVIAKVKSTTKYLNLHEAGTTNSEVFGTRLNAGQKVGEKNTHVTSAAKNYECTSNDGCLVFSSQDPAVGINPNKIGASGNDIPALDTYSDFTNVGFVTVSLSSEAPDSDCASLCLDIYEVATEAGYASTLSSVGEVPCADLTPVGGGAPTGSFASYTILIGGAFVAIAAIALARKNNKFYKI